MDKRWNDILRPFKKVKTPGFGISQQYYLSVLACTPSLPALLTVINPKGEGGAAVGFGLPWKKDVTEQEIAQPLIRGEYIMSSHDRKTVLRVKVLSKEEAGFDPSFLLTSPLGEALDPEVKNRLLAAWNLIQFTIESHDPMVYPALDFITSCAVRLADLTDGVVADPMSQTYRLPDNYTAEHDPGVPFTTLNHVQAKEVKQAGGSYVHTLGLQKFGLSELEVIDVPGDQAEQAALVLLGLAQKMMMGVKVEAGDGLGPKGALVIAEGGLDRARWGQTKVFELIPADTGQLGAAIKAAAEENS
jgi:hypothetical protein